MTNGERFDRRLTIVLILSGVVLASVLAFAIVAVPTIISTGSSTDAIQYGTDLSSCRAGFSSSVTEAQTALFGDKATLDVLTSRAFRAAIQRDQAVLDEQVTKSPALEAKVVADVAVVNMRTQEYRDAVQLAKNDPVEFLRRCEGTGR